MIEEEMKKEPLRKYFIRFFFTCTFLSVIVNFQKEINVQTW